MTVLRLGVVGYLNARPLVHALDLASGRYAVRFDAPARCAEALHGGSVDLGTIPSIEYLRGNDYRVVPGVAIGCDGPVASVAMFSRVPVEQVRTLALDTNSRTSVILARILCAGHFGISPEYRPMAQDPAGMLAACDAAVVIGDAALLFDHGAAGAQKIDLGEAWKSWTGLPFVFAFWAGRAGAVTPGHVADLVEARDRAVAAPADVAAAFFRGDPRLTAVGARYLRDNVKYGFSERQIEGVTRFYGEAAALGLVPGVRELRFYEQR